MFVLDIVNSNMLAKVYRNLYPWQSLDQFVNQIKNTIAYTSEDGSIIALNKPFGVGIYTVQDKNVSKQNKDKVLAKLAGHPKYCLQDALKPLTDELGSPEPYEVIKGIDRYMSGLTLITNDRKRQQANFRRSISASRHHKWPPYGLRTITSGYPTIKSDKIYEKVGVELVEIDEFGDHKEPVIVKNPSRKFGLGSYNSSSVFQVEMEVKKINREYPSALVELYISKIAWDFPRCYMSSKTSFILGDVRFSRRIREVLGKPIQVSAYKASPYYDDSNYEPLNSALQSRLGVQKNASIPLMLDLHTIRLKNFYPKQKNPEKQNLVITSPYMPAHFALTADCLGLLPEKE